MRARSGAEQSFILSRNLPAQNLERIAQSIQGSLDEKDTVREIIKSSWAIIRMSSGWSTACTRGSTEGLSAEAIDEAHR